MIASTSFGAFSSGATATPKPAATAAAAAGTRPDATVTPAASRTLAAAPLQGSAPTGPAPRRGSLLDIQA